MGHSTFKNTQEYMLKQIEFLPHIFVLAFAEYIVSFNPFNTKSKQKMFFIG